MSVDALRLGDYVVTPLITSVQASNKNFFEGEDEQGPFVACLLGNHPRAKLYGWYVKVSPEDRNLMQRYNWCGCVDRDSIINVRRYELMLGGKQRHCFLGKEIWKQMGRDPATIFRLSHPLDFRRHNLSGIPTREGCRGVTWNSREQRLYVQLVLPLGTVSFVDDGYRIYNRYLRDLKLNNPEDARIQAMLYNDVNPMF